MGWTVLGSLVQAGCSEVGRGETEGSGPGRDIWWHGTPGRRSRKCRCLRQQQGYLGAAGRSGGGPVYHAGCIESYEDLRAPDQQAVVQWN